MSQIPNTQPRVVGSFFPIEGSRGAYDLLVVSNDFPRGGRFLMARVGRQDVQGITAFEGGFTGRLNRTPNEGDRLFLGYPGTAEVATGVTFRSSGVTAPRQS